MRSRWTSPSHDLLTMMRASADEQRRGWDCLIGFGRYFFVLLLHWAPSTWISLRSDLVIHTAHSHSRSLNTAIALFRALGCYLLHILLYYCAVQCYVLLYTGYILGYSGLGRRVEKRWRGGFMLPPCAAGVRKVPYIGASRRA